MNSDDHPYFSFEMCVAVNRGLGGYNGKLGDEYVHT